MSRRSLGSSAMLVSALLAVTATPWTYAQRYGSYIVQTPYGPIDMRSPEWRMSGGDPDAYFALKMQQLRQKAMTQEYQVMMKQQQAFEKWYSQQKANKETGKPTDPAFDQLQQAQRNLLRAAQAKKDAAKDRLKKRRELIKKGLKKSDAEDKKGEATTKDDAATSSPHGDPGPKTGPARP